VIAQTKLNMKKKLTSQRKSERKRTPRSTQSTLKNAKQKTPKTQLKKTDEKAGESNTVPVKDDEKTEEAAKSDTSMNDVGKGSIVKAVKNTSENSGEADICEVSTRSAKNKAKKKSVGSKLKKVRKKKNEAVKKSEEPAKVVVEVAEEITNKTKVKIQQCESKKQEKKKCEEAGKAEGAKVPKEEVVKSKKCAIQKDAKLKEESTEKEGNRAKQNSVKPNTAVNLEAKDEQTEEAVKEGGKQNEDDAKKTSKRASKAAATLEETHGEQAKQEISAVPTKPNEKKVQAESQKPHTKSKNQKASKSKAIPKTSKSKRKSTTLPSQPKKKRKKSILTEYFTGKDEDYVPGESSDDSDDVIDLTRVKNQVKKRKLSVGSESPLRPPPRKRNKAAAVSPKYVWKRSKQDILKKIQKKDIYDHFQNEKLPISVQRLQILYDQFHNKFGVKIDDEQSNVDIYCSPDGKFTTDGAAIFWLHVARTKGFEIREEITEPQRKKTPRRSGLRQAPPKIPEPPKPVQKKSNANSLNPNALTKPTCRKSAKKPPKKPALKKRRSLLTDGSPSSFSPKVREVANELASLKTLRKNIERSFPFFEVKKEND